MKTITKLFLASFLIIFVSCNGNKIINERMDRIKMIGDSDPQLALAMLDSLETVIRNKPQNIVNRYDLLKIRLQDKSYIPAMSDIAIQQVLTYYEKNGTNSEKQEAYFYAGSVYRDLHDTPRSLEYFLKSTESALNAERCDSLLLRNAYSNLSYTFFMVQDYKDAYKTAMHEYEVSKSIGNLKLTCLIHIGSALMSLNKVKEAHKYFLLALDKVASDKEARKETENICHVLFYLVACRDKKNATRCYNILTSNGTDNEDELSSHGLAAYYRFIGDDEKAISVYKKLLKKDPDIFTRYDAAKDLYRFYEHQGDFAETLKYAKLSIQLGDSIDFGNRQELAATVANEFQYHLDKEKEEKILLENRKSKKILNAFIISSIVIILICTTIIVYRRNRLLKATLQIKEKISETKEKLKKNEEDLETTRKQLKDVSTQLNTANVELANKEHLLKEKTAQVNNFINILHQSDFASKTEDVINLVRMAAEGRYSMTDDNWKQLYKAVDELYPSFKKQILTNLVNFTEIQVRMCYLIRIGLTNSQIQNLTNLSRATVWRWVKKLNWIIASDYR